MRERVAERAGQSARYGGEQSAGRAGQRARPERLIYTRYIYVYIYSIYTYILDIYMLATVREVLAFLPGRLRAGDWLREPPANERA